jgi:signal peptidase I
MRTLLAVILTLMLPGFGHVVVGRSGRGVVVAVSFLIATLSMPFTYMAGFLAGIAIRLGGAIDVLVLRRRSAPGWDALVLPTALVVGALVAAALVIRSFYLEAFKIPTGGDLPTLAPGDHIFAGKWDTTPVRGDLIIFVYPRDPSKDFIKRVVAVAGDRVSVRGATLLVNGNPATTGEARPCTFWDLDDRQGTWREVAGTCTPERLGEASWIIAHSGPPSPHGDFPQDAESFTVPAGTVFVLGDHRDNSFDSRFWGTVPLENVKGKALFVWWSRGPQGIRWERLGRRLD